MSKYVLSASEFKTKKDALKKIQNWFDNNDLEGMPHIYEVVKKFEVKPTMVAKKVEL